MPDRPPGTAAVADLVDLVRVHYCVTAHWTSCRSWRWGEQASPRLARSRQIPGALARHAQTAGCGSVFTLVVPNEYLRRFADQARKEIRGTDRPTRRRGLRRRATGRARPSPSVLSRRAGPGPVLPVRRDHGRGRTHLPATRAEWRRPTPRHPAEPAEAIQGTSAGTSGSAATRLGRRGRGPSSPCRPPRRTSFRAGASGWCPPTPTRRRVSRIRPRAGPRKAVFHQRCESSRPVAPALL